MKARTNSYDTVTNTHNNVSRMVYGYLYTGKINDLIVEDQAAEGFLSFPYQDIFNLSETNKKLFIPGLIDKERMESVYQKLLDSVPLA